jgi:hypothetical protein
MLAGNTFVGVRLRPGRNNKWRVAPVATFEDGVLIVLEQVEVRRPGHNWQPASDTWQSLLAFEGVEAVRQTVIGNGGCFVAYA